MVKKGTFASPAIARASSAAARRTDQQQAARDTAAKPLELTGVSQELDDLLQIEFRFVGAGHVLEGHATMRFGQKLGAALAECERLPASALHPPRQENPPADQRHKRQPGHPQKSACFVSARRLCCNRDALVVEVPHQRRIAWRISPEVPPIGKSAVDFRPLDHDIAQAILINFAEQLRVRNIPRVYLQGENVVHIFHIGFTLRDRTARIHGLIVRGCGGRQQCNDNSSKGEQHWENYSSCVCFCH
jgi:hypothetical protein